MVALAAEDTVQLNAAHRVDIVSTCGSSWQNCAHGTIGCENNLCAKLCDSYSDSIHRGHHRGETHVNGRPNRELRERRTANCETFRENSIHLVRRRSVLKK